MEGLELAFDLGVGEVESLHELVINPFFLSGVDVRLAELSLEDVSHLDFAASPKNHELMDSINAFARRHAIFLISLILMITLHEWSHST